MFYCNVSVVLLVSVKYYKNECMFIHVEKFAEDTITVFKDTSPPRIDNLWLSRGDRINISVHSIEDFTKMTYVFSFC
jgi:hypothetical protein